MALFSVFTAVPVSVSECVCGCIQVCPFLCETEEGQPAGKQQHGRLKGAVHRHTGSRLSGVLSSSHNDRELSLSLISGGCIFTISRPVFSMKQTDRVKPGESSGPYWSDPLTRAKIISISDQIQVKRGCHHPEQEKRKRITQNVKTTGGRGISNIFGF